MSDLAGADLSSALDSATGVIETLVDNGSSAIGIVQHIADDLGNLGDLADGTPLEMVTGVIDGITGSTDGNPIDLLTNVVGGITGTESSLGIVTNLLGSITGSLNGGALSEVTHITADIDGVFSGGALDSVGTTISNATDNLELGLDGLTGGLSDGSLDGIHNLISISLNGESENSLGVDHILTAITGMTSTVTTVTDSTGSTSTYTETITSPSTLTNLSDDLFHSLNLF